MRWFDRNINFWFPNECFFCLFFAINILIDKMTQQKNCLFYQSSIRFNLRKFELVLAFWWKLIEFDKQFGSILTNLSNSLSIEICNIKGEKINQINSFKWTWLVPKHLTICIVKAVSISFYYLSKQRKKLFVHLQCFILSFDLIGLFFQLIQYFSKYNKEYQMLEQKLRLSWEQASQSNQ